MLAATFIAIFLIPVLFYVVERFSQRNGEEKREPPPVDEVASSQPATTKDA
jgi:hypothetical protein